MGRRHCVVGCGVTLVLLVEDEPHLVRTLRINLAARGFDVVSASDGRGALQVVHEGVPDVVVLDLGLPDMEGVEVLRQIREVWDVPVIVLSARHAGDDKIEALDAGADDYVTKPFSMEEFLARVRAAVRRGGAIHAQVPVVVRTADFEIDFGAKQAYRDGVPIRLTPTEWRLLEVLVRHRGQLVSQVDLLRAAWGPGYGRESNYLRVYANQLRRKLEPDPGRPKYLVTEPGLGYRLLV